MRVQWSGIDEVETLRPEWDALADALAVPFAGSGWCLAWWRAFGSGRLAVCTMRDDAGLAGVFPLARDGRTAQALVNAETPAFRPLARDEAALDALCQAVVRAGASLEVAALPADDAGHRALVRAADASRRLHSSVEAYESPVTVIEGSFEDYREERRSQWKETERRMRKLHREHEVDVALLERPIDVDAGLREGLQLEASGWKGEEGTAILSADVTRQFYEAVARDADQRGELRFSSVRVDGRLAAFDLAFLAHGRYFLLKTAYDEELKTFGPGLVLRRLVIERCFEEGLAAHEFLGNDMEWKRLFSTTSRRHVHFRAYRKSAAGLAEHLYRSHVRTYVRRARDRLGSR